MQSIVYGQFLPEILSDEMLDKFGLRLNKGSTYFPEANPTLRNEFSTAANRYGHSQVQVHDCYTLRQKSKVCLWPQCALTS